MPADAALRALLTTGAVAVLCGCGGSRAPSQAAPWPNGPWPGVVKGYFMEACESSGLDPRTVDAYCACALGVQMRRNPRQKPATAYEPGDDAAMHPHHFPSCKFN
jgi:hypothetical protein